MKPQLKEKAEHCRFE